jgi:23S rRNA (cytosine1962-C5)-methyltransferase
VITAAFPKPIHVKLSQDVGWLIKQGFPWVYAHSLVEVPSSKPGSFALLHDRSGEIIAKGFLDSNSTLAFRVLSTNSNPFTPKDIVCRLEHAWELRSRMPALQPDQQTNCFRLVNGEGDLLPGLVVDIYDTVAVLKCDGNGPAQFWDCSAIADWIIDHTPVRSAILRSRDENTATAVLRGSPPEEISVKEYGHSFLVNIFKGQKTGFFLDQRENRRLLGSFSTGRTVLNLCSYTGGFSVYAGAAGATEVTSVDLAAPAIAAADANWALNGLEPKTHAGVVADVFDFLAEHSGQKWDIVIADPPAFVRNERQLDAGLNAYERLFSTSLKVVAPRGIFAASSCSAHVSFSQFEETVRSSLSKARRAARVLGIYGQPLDHPFPLACPALRYLKMMIIELC